MNVFKERTKLQVLQTFDIFYENITVEKNCNRKTAILIFFCQSKILLCEFRTVLLGELFDAMDQ